MSNGGLVSFRAGLKAVLSPVKGLGAKHVLMYLPKAISPTAKQAVFVLATTKLTRGDPEKKTPSKGQIVTNVYDFGALVCVPWQDNEEAENTLAPFLNLVPAAIDADPQLGNRLAHEAPSYSGGLCWCDEGEFGFSTIGGVEYRCIKFNIHGYERFAYGAAGL